MRINQIIIFWFLILLGCGHPSNKIESDTGVEVWIEKIYINQYESDSLNKNRSYVIPRIYYVFGYRNSTVDSVYVSLDSHFEKDDFLPPYLYVMYRYRNEIDTLVLTDYESVNPILLDPKTSSSFIVGAPIPEETEKGLNDPETVSILMKFIADNGEVIYAHPDSSSKEKLLKSQTIKKSKDFRIVFRDPDDTTVE